MTATLEPGSYRFSDFDDTEYQRLIRQGSATWPQEREFLHWAGLRPGQAVADIGCGPGVISRLMADVVGPEGWVTGLDVSEQLLETARRLAAPNAGFDRASVYDLSGHRGLYDFAYVRLVFQHLERPMEAMAEVFSVLKPGGRALVLDSDESVFALHPEPQDLRPFIEETQALQRANGGDRFVGGKLGWYMRTAGFEEVEPQMFVMTPEMMGRETFLDIVLKFRPMLFPAERRDEATATMERLHAIARDTMVYGHNGSFVVRGTRPVA